MKNKPDDRRDNVDKIQCNISDTIRNIHRAEEMIEKTDDENTKRELSEKNDRREQALKGLRKEIKDEAINAEINYK
ncbi:small acid-soluble spore protein Tlp [Clostridium sardiniense]|uniref:Protein Tlp homolog n=1 Tax=Clostridium sardiniense TaxID=29369 RepID=A0ABS7L2C4_CLOSR|nr:small acid-soluble spore protein Tlp [Clostridium sardiniense]MBY0757231.1 small acid-soluble spore protein Tlp [Clostridium sardiniense]MBY0757236.1 small acid-soluble spore protein Tlp [Clostridium sardiniense]MDQ0460152.1 small acid-soluble spore protein (thioredoxin-like protein) [Clostridium sardiniense]